MLELYCDDLTDLLAEHKKGDKLVSGGPEAGATGEQGSACLRHFSISGANLGKQWHWERGSQSLHACPSSAPNLLCRRASAYSPLPCPFPPHSLQYKAPKLEIKKDPKGVVTVPGTSVVDNITSARELMDVIESGLARRRVASTQVSAGRGGVGNADREVVQREVLVGAAGGKCTGSVACHASQCTLPNNDLLLGVLLKLRQLRPCWRLLFHSSLLAQLLHQPSLPFPPCLQMNRESSRSHLIITVCIESTNLQTQSVARGKLSFVDLAGSERWVGWGCGPGPASAHAADSLRSNPIFGSALYSALLRLVGLVVVALPLSKFVRCFALLDLFLPVRPPCLPALSAA